MIRSASAGTREAAVEGGAGVHRPSRQLRHQALPGQVQHRDHVGLEPAGPRLSGQCVGGLRLELAVVTR